MEFWIILVTAAALVAFGLASARLENSPLTAPMVFTALGLVMSPLGLDWVDMPPTHPAFRTLAEITLVLVLYTDASRINFRLMENGYPMPLRLLAIGMPLCMLAGVVVGRLVMPGLGWWSAAVAATILAPTDAALSQAVVANESVPVRVRQGLNVESGLNDGLALPVVLVALAVADAHAPVPAPRDWVVTLIMAVVLGPATGVAVGMAGAVSLDWARRRGSINQVYLDLATLVLALAAYAAADLVGGNGFMAALAAGLTVGAVSRELSQCLWRFAEAEGQLLVLVSFMLFGAVLAPDCLREAGWRVWLYAGLSLTVVRMLPASLSLVGMKLRPSTHLFLGWFGPRGLASVLYMLIMLEGFQVPGGHQVTLLISATVLASIYLHGLSAAPLASLYAKGMEKIKSQPGGDQLPEMMEVPKMPLRLPFAHKSHRKR